MDAKRIEEIRRCTENPDHVAKPYWYDCPVDDSRDEQITNGEVRELLDAYESLQRIAELPERFQLIAGVHHESGLKGSESVVTAYIHCADELQQALPEDLRHGD